MNTKTLLIIGIIATIGIIGSVIIYSAEQKVMVQEEKFVVYTTFYPLTQFTKNIAGDVAIVKSLIPPTADPHLFDLGPQSVASLTKADMLVYNGADFEPYIDEIESSSDFSHVILVDSSEGITLLEGEEHDHGAHGGDEEHDEHTEEFLEEIAHTIEEFEDGHINESQTLAEVEEILHEHENDGHKHGGKTIKDIEMLLQEINEGHIEAPEGIEEIHHLVSGEDVHDKKHEDTHDEDLELGHIYDPHIWLDPILAKKQVMTIASHLAQSDPANEEIYHANALLYAERLDMLDQEIRDDLSSCKRDTFVPFHNAFSYFAERYDLKTLAVIQEFSPEAPVTAKDIEELIHFAEDNDIKYFFTEENRNPKLSVRLAAELGGDILLFSPLEALTPEDDPNTTYFDKMRMNVDNLQIALECT